MNSTKKSSKPLTVTDQMLLRHIGAYYFTCKESAAVAVFSADDNPIHRAANALSSLAKLGYLRDHDGDTPLAFDATAKRKTRYYLLTAEGFAYTNVPKDRKQTPGETSLAKNLALLWYCTLDGQRRYRLEKEDLYDTFGGKKKAPYHNVPHVVSQATDAPPVIERLVISSADVRNTISKVRKHISEDLNHPVLGSWVETGSYAYTLLGSTPDVRDDYAEMITNSTGKHPPLNNLANVRAGLGPSPETFSLCLTEYHERLNNE